MNREEYLIYCLLYAIDAAGVKKQNLVQMALKVDAVNFVRIYNLIQQHDEETRMSVITSNLDVFNKDDIKEEIRNIFLADMESDIQESVVEVLDVFLYHK